MTIRWGIVTAAKICSDFVNAFNSYPDKGDQAIVAIAARNKDRAAEFAKLHNIPKVFESYRALAESKDIDVAYIGALNPDHYELAKLFLENGKHVLCEKPFTLNYKQSLSIINLAKKKNLFIMEAFWSRFSPIYVDLEKDINAGKLGEIKFIEANLGFNMSTVERLNKREFGGSAVMDVGVYTLQLSQYIFKDEPIKVTAFGNLNKDGVDVGATIVLEYTGGRRAVLNAHGHLDLCNRANIYGTKGRVTLEEPFHFPEQVIGVDGKTRSYPLHKSKIPYNFVNSAGLVFQAIEVARCIRAGLIESPRMSHKETLLLAKIEDSIRQQLGVHYDADDKQYP